MSRKKEVKLVFFERNDGNVEMLVELTDDVQSDDTTYWMAAEATTFLHALFRRVMGEDAVEVIDRIRPKDLKKKSDTNLN